MSKAVKLEDLKIIKGYIDKNSGGGVDVVQEIGSSTTSVMSQKAVSDELSGVMEYAEDYTNNQLANHNNTTDKSVHPWLADGIELAQNAADNAVSIAENKASKDVATIGSDGLMSAADKLKLDEIEEGANRVVVDSELSTYSENPLQNKVITELFHDASSTLEAIAANGRIIETAETDCNKLPVVEGTFYNPNGFGQNIPAADPSMGVLIVSIKYITQKLASFGPTGMYVALQEGVSFPGAVAAVKFIRYYIVSTSSWGDWTLLPQSVNQTTGQSTFKVMSQKAVTDALDEKISTAYILEKFYPVGAIYLTTDVTSPATLFGGTWTRITSNVYLKANTGGIASAGTTGGTSTHKISVDNLPSHGRHLYDYNNWSAYGNRGNANTEWKTKGVYFPADYPASYGTSGRGWDIGLGNEVYPAGQNLGGGSAYLPYYYNVNVWRRTA